MHLHHPVRSKDVKQRSISISKKETAWTHYSLVGWFLARLPGCLLTVVGVVLFGFLFVVTPIWIIEFKLFFLVSLRAIGSAVAFSVFYLIFCSCTSEKGFCFSGYDESMALEFLNICCFFFVVELKNKLIITIKLSLMCYVTLPTCEAIVRTCSTYFRQAAAWLHLILKVVG